jgi:hypothetical protein
MLNVPPRNASQKTPLEKRRPLLLGSIPLPNSVVFMNAMILPQLLFHVGRHFIIPEIQKIGGEVILLKPDLPFLKQAYKAV